MTQGYLNDDLNNGSQMQTTSAPRQVTQKRLPAQNGYKPPSYQNTIPQSGQQQSSAQQMNQMRDTQQQATQQQQSMQQSGQQQSSRSKGQQGYLGEAAGTGQGASSPGYINAATDTVEGRMDGLLSRDNDYMKSAETAGRQAAASRGLSNSSMAVGAAEAARINAALGIAQQDASLYGQSSLSAQGHVQSKDINDQLLGHNKELNADEFGYNTKLNEQGYKHENDSREDTQSHELGKGQIDHQNTMQQNANKDVRASQFSVEQQVSVIQQRTDMTETEKREAIFDVEQKGKANQNMIMHIANQPLPWPDFDPNASLPPAPAQQESQATTTAPPPASNSTPTNPNRSGNGGGYDGAD